MMKERRVIVFSFFVPPKLVCNLVIELFFMYLNCLDRGLLFALSATINVTSRMSVSAAFLRLGFPIPSASLGFIMIGDQYHMLQY